MRENNIPYDLPDKGIHVQMTTSDDQQEISSEIDGYNQVFDKKVGLQPVHLERKKEDK